jgi:hypothetical protein
VARGRGGRQWRRGTGRAPQHEHRQGRGGRGAGKLLLVVTAVCVTVRATVARGGRGGLGGGGLRLPQQSAVATPNLKPRPLAARCQGSLPVASSVKAPYVRRRLLKRHDARVSCFLISCRICRIARVGYVDTSETAGTSIHRRQPKLPCPLRQSRT